MSWCIAVVNLKGRVEIVVIFVKINRRSASSLQGVVSGGVLTVVDSKEHIDRCGRSCLRQHTWSLVSFIYPTLVWLVFSLKMHKRISFRRRSGDV